MLFAQAQKNQVIAQDKRAEDAEYCCEDESGITALALVG